MITINKPTGLPNEKAKQFCENYERDARDLDYILEKFNERYGKFILGFTFYKAENSAWFIQHPVIDGSLYNQIDGTIVFDKGFLEELRLNSQL